MFQIMRRIHASIPLAFLLIGLLGQPVLLVLPPGLATTYLLIRHRVIRRRVGQAAWPSDAFSRHVLVDDLGWLTCFSLLGLPLFLLAQTARGLTMGG